MGRTGTTKLVTGARGLFSAERMVQETVRLYRRVALHPHVEDS